LVGKNIVFDSQWMDYVGNGKPLSEQQFQAWLKRLDRVYDSYEDLVGSKPAGVEKITIALRPGSEFPSNLIFSAASKTEKGVVHINKDDLINHQTRGPAFFKGIQSESVTEELLQGMAHVFVQNRSWGISARTESDLLIGYALEAVDGHYFFENIKMTGPQHIKGAFGIANIARTRNTITPITEPGKMNGVHNFYLFGLVETAGWDAYKKALRSYDDPKFTPSFTYKGKSPQHERARDLFDRLSQFSGKPDVLKSLPDKGELLEKHLPVTKTPTRQRD
jgi:hypothetical protein